MSRFEAEKIVGGAWRGVIPENDNRLSEALATLGMNVTGFRKFAHEARRCEKSRDRALIYIPMGGRRRR